MTGCHPISRAAFVFRTPRQSVLRSLNISLSTGNLGTSSCLHLQGTRLQACLIRYPPPHTGHWMTRPNHIPYFPSHNARQVWDTSCYQPVATKHIASLISPMSFLFYRSHFGAHTHSLSLALSLARWACMPDRCRVLTCSCCLVVWVGHFIHKSAFGRELCIPILFFRLVPALAWHFVRSVHVSRNFFLIVIFSYRFFLLLQAFAKIPSGF